LREDLVARAEQALLTRQQLPAEFGADAVRPSYDGLGLVNVSAWALRRLLPNPSIADQQPAPPVAPDLLGDPDVTAVWEEWLARGPINHIVLLLVDALGYDQLRAMMADGTTPELAAAVARPETFFTPITTVYPSTTTTALTAAATAHTPAEHGIMATVVYMREIGSAVNLIGYRPAIAPTYTPYTDTQLNPDALVPVPNIYRRLEQAGVTVEIVNAAQYKGTSISRFTSAGSRAGQQGYRGYLTPADGLSQCRERVIANTSRGKSFIYMYVSTVDTAAHRYGPMHHTYRAETAALDFGLRRELFAPLAGRSDTVLLLVADHGQRRSHNDKVAWIDQHPELARMLAAPVAGEGRAGYFYLKHGMERSALSYIEQHLSQHFLAVPKARAVELGLFGPPGAALGPQCDDRIGDIVLAPTTDWIVRHHVTSDERTPPYTGLHGGLSRSEMLVPFMAYRFG
jgi:hypothetical protein